MASGNTKGAGLAGRLFGTVRYAPPDWLAVRDRRATIARRGLGIVVVIAALVAGYLLTRPAPANVSLAVTPPPVTPIVDDQPIPQPLRIAFGPQGPDGVASVAPLGAIGRPLGDEARLVPDKPGRWLWRDDQSLEFQPDGDWPADQIYRIRLAPAALAESVRLPSDAALFSTPPFTASIDEIRFHQDPVNTEDRRVVATLSFSHAVSAEQLDARVHVSLRNPDDGVAIPRGTLPVDIRLDRHGRIAYLRSASIALPASETFALLTVDEALGPIDGDTRLQSDLTADVLVPDRDSWFRVESVQSLIARDEDDRPRQTLIVQLSDRAATTAVNNAVRAWVLPADHRMDNTLHRGYRWRSASEVTPDVLARAERVTLKQNPTNDTAAALQSFTYRAPENRHLLVRVTAGLESTGGYALAAEYNAVARVPSWPQEVRIARDGGLLPLTGNRQLDVLARGQTALRVDVGRLIDDRISHLVSQTGGDITNPWFTNHNFGEQDITVRQTRYLDLAASDPSEPVYASVDLGEQTGEGGFYFVTVRGWDRPNNRPVGGMDSRFVLVTDLGLLAKTSADGSQHVFVHGIAANAPVAGAQVALLGRNGLPVYQGVTGDDGHLALPSSRGLKDERQPVAFLVRRDRDAAFMPYQRNARRLDYSRFDIGGAYDAPGTARTRLLAHVFTDRGLYRPGETVRMGAIVKRGDWATLDGLPVKLDVLDPRGRRLLERTARLNSDGLVDWQFAVDDTAPTGQWSATVYRPRSANTSRVTLGNVAFTVAEFQPDRTRIRATLDGAGAALWLKPGPVGATVQLRNLFGTPAAGRRVTARARLVPASMAPPGFAGFTFADPFQRPGRALTTVDIAVAEATSNAEGIAELEIPVGAYDQGIYRLELTAEGFEPGDGRSVTAAAVSLLSPLDVVAGFAADGDLAFIHKDAPRSVTFVAVDRSGKAIALPDTRVAIVELRDVSTLVQQPDGTYSYESVAKELDLSETPLPIAIDGSAFTLPTDTAGRFVARLVDDAGTALAHVAYRVAGSRNLAGRLEAGAEIDLALDKTSYAPGDTITLQMTTPYTGRGLISIESDRVYTWRWFDAGTTSSVQTIDMPAGLEGNAYVNVALIRDLGSDEIFVSPLSYAVAPFRVDAGERRLDIELTVPDKLRPGTPLTVDYRSDRPSRLIVFAVDEGILQAAGYDDPDPLALFLRKQALRVATHQIVDLVIPDFDLASGRSAPGGGDAMSRMGRNLNPFQRGNRPPVAFWSGIVDADPTSRQLRFDVPDDFNGGLRVIAVGVSQGAAGLARTDTVVSGPFVIIPGVPTVVAPGDEFEVAVGLANNQPDGDAPITLSVLASAGLELTGPDSIPVAVPAGREGQARFRLRASDRLGAATLSFTATANGDTATLTAHTSVRPAIPNATTVASGRVKGRSGEVAIDRDMYPQLASRQIAVSASPIVLAGGLQEYLWQFPHQCAEQIVSRVFPQIGLARTHPQLVDEIRLAREFDKLIAKLRTRQSPEGGFAFWPGAGEAAELPSVYILHFLTDAAELGLAVPPEMLSRGRVFLERLAAQPGDGLAAARLRAYAMYVMTRGGKVTTSYLTQLHESLERDHPREWRGDIAAGWMAASYALLRDNDLSSSLIGGYRPSQGEEQDLDSSLTRDAQYLYLTARHFPERSITIGDRLVERLAKAVFDGRFNTLSSAYTILALGEFSRATAGVMGGTRVTALGPDDARTVVATDGTLLPGAALPLDSIRVLIEGARDPYYSLSQTGFDRPAGDAPVRDGLEIQRDYLDDNDEPVAAARLGQELRVRLRVRSLAGRVGNVAIVDLLPGGFQIQGTELDDASRPYWVDHAEVREDRFVVYGRADERVSEIVYRVKATAAGHFTAPVAQARAMYRRDVVARTAAGRFSVDAPQ